MGRNKKNDNHYAKSIRITIAFPECEEDTVKEFDRLTKKYVKIADKKTGKLVGLKRSPQLLSMIKTFNSQMKKREMVEKGLPEPEEVSEEEDKDSNEEQYDEEDQDE